MTAGRYDNVSYVLLEHTLVFVLNYGCTDCGLLNVGKSEALKCAAHRGNTYSVVICDKRGSKADDNGITRLNKDAYLFDTVCDLLGILRALDNAVTAENTLVADDMSLVSRKADSLYGTLSYTAEAGFTV